MSRGLRVHEYLRACERLPLLTFPPGDHFGPAVVLAPHPDDESLGCGGLIALFAMSKTPIHVVFISDGSGSHANSTRWSRPRLARLRKAEAASALRCLGLTSDAAMFLDLPDRYVPGPGEDGFDEAVAAITSLCGRLDARSLFTTWRRDPHCDHLAAFEIGRAAAAKQAARLRLYEYVIWGRALPADIEIAHPPRGLRIDISNVVHLKEQAIRRHVSQTTSLIDDDPNGFRLTEAMIEPFLKPYETYLDNPCPVRATR